MWHECAPQTRRCASELPPTCTEQFTLQNSCACNTQFDLFQKPKANKQTKKPQNSQLFHFSPDSCLFFAVLTLGWRHTDCLAQKLLVWALLIPLQASGFWSINSLKQSDPAFFFFFHFLSQNWRDVAVVAEVSGWLFSFWRLAQDFRKDSCLPQLFRGALYSCQGRTKEIWGDL